MAARLALNVLRMCGCRRRLNFLCFSYSSFLYHFIFYLSHFFSCSYFPLTRSSGGFGICTQIQIPEGRRRQRCYNTKRAKAWTLCQLQRFSSTFFKFYFSLFLSFFLTVFLALERKRKSKRGVVRRAGEPPTPGTYPAGCPTPTYRLHFDSSFSRFLSVSLTLSRSYFAETPTVFKAQHPQDQKSENTCATWRLDTKFIPGNDFITLTWVYSPVQNGSATQRLIRNYYLERPRWSRGDRKIKNKRRIYCGRKEKK